MVVVLVLVVVADQCGENPQVLCFEADGAILLPVCQQDTADAVDYDVTQGKV